MYLLHNVFPCRDGGTAPGWKPSADVPRLQPPGTARSAGLAGERRKPYLQGPLHLLPLLLAFGAGACALVHGSAVVMDSQEHSTLHYRLRSRVPALCCQERAAVFIRVGGSWAVPHDAGPAFSGCRLAGWLRAWGGVCAVPGTAEGSGREGAADVCGRSVVRRRAPPRRGAGAAGGGRGVSLRAAAGGLCRLGAAGGVAELGRRGAGWLQAPRGARPPLPLLASVPSPTRTCSGPQREGGVPSRSRLLAGNLSAVTRF